MNFLTFPHSLKLVIFDVDGTLYDLKAIRPKVMRDLLLYYALRPHRIRELQIIHHFRKIREHIPETEYSNLDAIQYERCAQKVGLSPELVKKVIIHWMIEHPLPYLPSLMWQGVAEFFSYLRSQDIRIGIYSDFPAQKKMQSMQLPADIIIDSTEAEIDRLKPDPKGILYLIERFGVSPEETVFIGDRDDRDGEASRRAGVPYFILSPGESPYPSLLAALQNKDA